MRSHQPSVVLVAAILCCMLLASCGGSAASSGSAGVPFSNQAPSRVLPSASTADNTSAARPATEAPASVALSESETIPQQVPPATVAVNPYVATVEDHLSTFAIDVDTASYTAARNYLINGQLPPAEVVRVEEFVNYFDYDYPSPQEGAFGVEIESAPSPFGIGDTQIVRVGIQGKRVDRGERQNAVLTFVVDVSGSMQEPNKLPLVKDSLTLLLDELREGDKVGIVAYGSRAFVVLEHTDASQRDTILRALDSLGDGGSTNAEEGLRLGYAQAQAAFNPNAINRIILCSDGVANVGATGPDAIRAAIRESTERGVFLTTVGFGMGTYNDYLMEQLADDGDGNYAYVDTVHEAQRIFSESLMGTLQVIAKDAKIQVEFDPAVVASYRLLGYENRDVADADFRNDRVDAGEVGAGHSVTALYELRMREQAAGTALTVRLRYQNPESGDIFEYTRPFATEQFGRDFATATPQMQLAVGAAAFAEELRGSFYAQDRPLHTARLIADHVAELLPEHPDAQELARLIAQAEGLE